MRFSVKKCFCKINVYMAAIGGNLHHKIKEKFHEICALIKLCYPTVSITITSFVTSVQIKQSMRSLTIHKRFII